MIRRTSVDGEGLKSSAWSPWEGVRGCEGVRV